MAAEYKSVSFETKSAEALRHFFEIKKKKYHEIYVVLTNKQVNTQPVSFNGAVEEAVKQGLIDSRTKTLTEQKCAIRFTKRRTESFCKS